MILTRTFYSLPQAHPSASLQNSPREKKIMLLKPYPTEWNKVKKRTRPTMWKQYLSARAKTPAPKGEM